MSGPLGAKRLGRIHGRLAHDLGVAIVGGRYLPGERLPGEAKDPLSQRKKAWIEPGDFASRSAAHLQALIDEFLLGAAPFTAKLKPEYSANYTDHDQVARVAEWWGRRT
jgi:hypothetical protein